MYWVMHSDPSVVQSAAMGLAIAGTIAMGYSNIFVTAPSPENLKTLFEFVCKGLDALDYNEHTDYDLVASTNPAFNKAVVRINVFRHHRQVRVICVQRRSANAVLGVDGSVSSASASRADGSGRAGGHRRGRGNTFATGAIDAGSISCVPMFDNQRLRRHWSESIAQVDQTDPRTESWHKEAARDGQNAERSHPGASNSVRHSFPVSNRRLFRRYAPGDKIETWLNELLCLNCADHIPSIPEKLPHPDQCDVFYVERSTLFSFHKQSEFFLQQMMSLYVASHYKNTPNDLVLISDAPAHRLFVLLGPIDPSIVSFFSGEAFCKGVRLCRMLFRTCCASFK